VLAGALAIRKLQDVDVEMDGRSGLAQGQVVSGDYFSVLGVRAILGRTMLPIDERVPGQNPVAVIGYDYWRTRFALDPGIIGKHVLLNNAPFSAPLTSASIAPSAFGRKASRLRPALACLTF
jgi:putative ABC transport system permease protein